MSKWCHADYLDGALNIVKANANALHLCSSQPADRAGVLAASLANVAVATGDFTLGDGASSARTLTVAGKAMGNATGTGSGTHYALIDGTRLLYVTTVSNPQTVTTGNPVTSGSFVITINQPT